MEIPEGFIDISPNQDKGIFKKIIKEGTGEATPKPNAEVFVHYTGTFFGGEKHGEKFDSSRDRGEKFSFTLGEGQVIKSWDMGVATMKKNEVCELISKPEYAYGSTDHGGIPANSTLKFEVELFEWKGKDISQNKDGSLLQVVISEGVGWESPKDCSLAKITIKSSYNEVVFDEREVSFEIGDYDSANLIPGIELAVKKMKKDELSSFEIGSSLAYGNAGFPEKNIPSNATITCEIRLIEFDKVKDSYSIDNPEDKLKWCEDFKQKATDKFQAGKLNYAIKLYEKAATYIDFESDFKDENKNSRDKLLLILKLNLALCYIKIEDASSAINEAEKSLELDKTNEKGLYRLGQALLMKGDYEMAKQNFAKVIEVNKDNAQAAKQIKVCDFKINELLKQEKQLYKSMFSKIGGTNKKLSGDDATEEANKNGEAVQS